MRLKRLILVNGIGATALLLSPLFILPYLAIKEFPKLGNNIIGIPVTAALVLVVLGLILFFVMPRFGGYSADYFRRRKQKLIVHTTMAILITVALYYLVVDFYPWIFCKTALIESAVFFISYPIRTRRSKITYF